MSTFAQQWCLWAALFAFLLACCALFSLFSPAGTSTLYAVQMDVEKVDMGADGFLPKSTSAWIDLSDPDATTEPCGGVYGPIGGAAPQLQFVTIPRVSASDAHSYGNMHTCRRGFRLHAYRGVKDASCVFPCLVRKIELSLKPGGKEEVDEGSKKDGLVVDAGASQEIVVFDIDTWLHDAFIHWVCESAVFLEYWDDLQAMHPGIFLLFQQRRDYKLHFATELYGIPIDRIIFRDESPDIAALVALPGSLTYFPPFMTLLEEGNGDLPLFGALFHRLITRLRRLAGVDAPPPWLPMRALNLQRGSKENYVHNDYRVHAFLNGLAEAPVLLFSRVPLEMMEYDNFPSLKAQVIAQTEAKVFTVAYGSSLFLNAALARNATVFIDNPNGLVTHWYTYVGLAYEYGERCNRKIVDLQGIGVKSVAETVALLEEAYRSADWSEPEQCMFSEEAAAELCRTGRLKNTMAWGVACLSTFPEDEGASTF
jgi:hypothetical protein